jgi:hypothetical protein
MVAKDGCANPQKGPEREASGFRLPNPSGTSRAEYGSSDHRFGRKGNVVRMGSVLTVRHEFAHGWHTFTSDDIPGLFVSGHERDYHELRESLPVEADFRKPFKVRQVPVFSGYNTEAHTGNDRLLCLIRASEDEAPAVGDHHRRHIQNSY